jgi:hypothetical protein
VIAIGARVQAVDAQYYAHTFARDPEFAACDLNPTSASARR